MNTKRIYKEALPGAPTKKVSIDEERWFIDVRCHTKCNHAYRVTSHVDKDVWMNDSNLAKEVRNIQRLCRLHVDLHNKEIGEKSGKRRVRTSAKPNR